MDDILKEVSKKMDSALNNLRKEFSTIRTGKASPALLDAIRVEYYGTNVPIKQVANIGIPEPRLIVIQPWEQNMVPVIEKAIMASDLGLNPSSDGRVVRIPIPRLTEERRKELVKTVKNMGEDAKIAIRNIRREGNDMVKKQEKQNKITEDDKYKLLDDIQEITDKHTEKVDEIVEKKEKEMMEV